MRKLILLGAVSAAALGAAAMAIPGTSPLKMDADGNGTVSKAEAMAAADAMFAKMDVNGDGTINQADREAKVKEHFREMDADSNGSISEAEFVAAHNAKMAEREARRDDRGPDGPKGRHGKHHGGLDGGPRGGMMMLKAADANNDMAVTKAEFRTAAETRFAKADTNKDGSLSADEQKAARKAMRGPDRGPDADGPPPSRPAA